MVMAAAAAAMEGTPSTTTSVEYDDALLVRFSLAVVICNADSRLLAA